MASIEVRWGNYDWTRTEDEEDEDFDEKPEMPKRWYTKGFGDTDDGMLDALAFFIKKVQQPQWDWVELRSDLTGWDFLKKEKR